MTKKQKKRAVILLSGGLDSATVLAIARDQGFECWTLGVDYGQRHQAELQAAQRVATALGSHRHKLVEMDLRTIGGSALTDDIDVPETPQHGIPVTYVPARNTIFLGIALGYAETLDANHLFHWCQRSGTIQATRIVDPISLLPLKNSPIWPPRQEPRVRDFTWKRR